MRCLPDRFCEDIRIYRAATPDDDKDSDNYFNDPFVEKETDYSGSMIRAGWKLAEGLAYAQTDRSNVYRRTSEVDVDAVSFFNHFFIVRRLDGTIPEGDYGSIAREDHLYLWRLKEDPIINRHTIVYVYNYPNNILHIYTTDEREGQRTSVRF